MMQGFSRFVIVSIVLPLAGLTILSPHNGMAAYTQDFASMSAITDNSDPLKWAWYNKSQDPGSALNDSSVGGWFQGTPSGTFDAQSGAADSYARADFSSTQSGTISNWFITPTFDVNNGDTFSFYTRTTTGSTYPDRLQVRLSQAGTSTNVGSDYASVGDFSSLLVDVNPTLAQNGYPQTWTQYTYTFTGSAFTGRIGFRYFVTDTVNNGNYIGVDTFATSASLSNPVPEPSSYVLALSAIATLTAVRRRAGKRAQTQS